MSGSEFQIDELGKSFYYKDLGCSDWPIETVEPKGSCGPNNEAVVIEISFAVSQSSNKVLIASCLDMTTYQSLWSRHVIPKQIDQRNTGGNMPYFTDDGLYGFLWETYTYYTKVSKYKRGILNVCMSFWHTFECKPKIPKHNVLLHTSSKIDTFLRRIRQRSL